MTQPFFTEQMDQSQVKTAIVTKYFYAWSRVMTANLKSKSSQRIGYLDLFAGPGRYGDGTKSTPIQILEMAIADPALKDNLFTIFNDKEPENTSSLISAIEKIPGIDQLKHKPDVRTEEVGDRMVEIFEKMRMIPTLFFVDPWGYKGLSLRLINSVLKNWGCECIFFFNYSRVNMGLSNPLVQEHMDALFGDARGASLRQKLEPLNSSERELTIVEEICNALIEMGGKYTLPFCFKNNAGTRTKHHLIFVSKHHLGYDIMKGVMAAESSSIEQGVPSFEYSPASKNQPLLFELARPLDDLEVMLLEEFAGLTLRMDQIYQQHNYGRRYIEKNYKDVLTNLEKAGTIQGNPRFDKRRKIKGVPSCAGHVEFTFPSRRTMP